MLETVCLIDGIDRSRGVVKIGVRNNQQSFLNVKADAEGAECIKVVGTETARFEITDAVGLVEVRGAFYNIIMEIGRLLRRLGRRVVIRRLLRSVGLLFGRLFRIRARITDKVSGARPFDGAVDGLFRAWLQPFSLGDHVDEIGNDATRKALDV